MAFLQGYFQVPGQWIATRPLAVRNDDRSRAGRFT